MKFKMNKEFLIWLTLIVAILSLMIAANFHYFQSHSSEYHTISSNVAA